ncbi:hypothetical protein V495_08170, partial [Pseudogymnoascus sp. VKM F-4514 (FW-929)]
MSSSYNIPAWQQPTGDFSAANIYALRHGETPMNAARNGNLGLHYGREAPGEYVEHPIPLRSSNPFPVPGIKLLSTPSPSSSGMFSSLKASLRRKKSNLSTSSSRNSWNSADERELVSNPNAPPSP